MSANSVKTSVCERQICVCFCGFDGTTRNSRHLQKQRQNFAPNLE